MKIVLTERVTDLKWSDCTYLPIKLHSFPQPIHAFVPSQVSQNSCNTNAMQMNQHSPHQSYYAQDSVPQYSQSYIRSQLSTHHEPAPYHGKEYNHIIKDKIIYFDKLFISKSSNTHPKSQSLKPDTLQNIQLSKIEYLICGYCRKIFFIPRDIINLFIKYHGQKSKNTIIVRPCADGFNTVNYRTLYTIHYAPYSSKGPGKQNLIMNCIGHNVSLPVDIIQSYNISPLAEFTKMINLSDQFNVVFFESKRMYHAVIFDESIAFELTLPPYPYPISSQYSLCLLYSSKYGLLLLNQNNIQCFSLKHWKWSILVRNMHNFGLTISKRNSSFEMIGDDKFLMMTNGGYSFMIFNLSTLKKTFIRGRGNRRRGNRRRKNVRKPPICCDDTLHKRFYVCSVSGNVNARCQYYDMRTCQWDYLQNFFNTMRGRFDSIWLDDVDKNLLYAVENARIYVIDLRTKHWAEIRKAMGESERVYDYL